MAAGPSADVLGGGLSGQELVRAALAWARQQVKARGADPQTPVRAQWRDAPPCRVAERSLRTASTNRRGGHGREAARTHVQKSVPKSIVLGGRGDGVHRGAECEPVSYVEP